LLTELFAHYTVLIFVIMFSIYLQCHKIKLQINIHMKTISLEYKFCNIFTLLLLLTAHQ